MGEIPLPPELIDDWLSREGEPLRMAQIAEPYMTRPVDTQVLEQLAATPPPSAAPRWRAPCTPP